MSDNGAGMVADDPNLPFALTSGEIIGDVATVLVGILTGLVTVVESIVVIQCRLCTR